MVTVITSKLKKQSLEDLPNEPLRVSSNTEGRREVMLQADSPDRAFIFRVSNERRSGLGHLRTRSYPTHDFRGADCRGRTLFSDSCTNASSSTMPPASKKLCRSISVPLEESNEETALRSWAPKASKVWQPVKGFPRVTSRPRSVSSPPEKLYDTNTSITRSKTAETEVTSPAVNFISTPPASPTPRPASAFAALTDNQICMKENIKEESITPRKNATDSSSDACPRLHRSRSQPCFERARTCGIKRRIEDDFERGNKLRPALDLAKMEESSYFRFRDKKRGLRIPRCSNKREARESAAPYFTEHENFILKPIISSPLDAKVSSVMITPTSSPTKQIDLGENLTDKVKGISNKRKKVLESKIADEGVFHLDYDSELDIASIEGDNFY